VVTVYVVPHTHWDREWYATFETFRAQLVQLWDELLAMTESDPDFRFLMDGQTVVIDDYLEIRPAARERLERAVRRGQIQVGPWYTLPDEFLVSGETLVRDLQRGIASAEAHGGAMRAGYLPDSFGHAAQMPQIYRQFGFQYAAVWRGVPLEIDRVAFIWEAPDGSRILTAYMGNSYSHGVDLPTEPEALAIRIAGALKAIAPFHPTRDVLLMNGNDHVLPQRALSAAVRDASGRLDGTRIRLARLEDYLAVLPEEDWPHWNGELRSSARANLLMGTLSVRAPDKQRYAEATRTLERLAEPMAALSGAEVAAPLDEAWTLILQNAAHDTACGSGIDAVASESRRRSQSALQLGRSVINRCLPRLAGDGQVWNPSPFPRQGLVEVDGRLVLTPPIAGCSVASVTDTRPVAPSAASASRLENAVLSCDVNPDGTVTVVDKRTGRRYLGLHRLVDDGDAGDEYNFSPPAGNSAPPHPVRRLASRVIDPGPLRGRLEVRFELAVFSGLSADRQRRASGETMLPVRLLLSIEADTPRLDIDLEVMNRATDHRLRVHFPLPFATTGSAADTPFHVTRRSAIKARRDPGAPELELPTYPMWSFVEASGGGASLALIADGLHEYELCPGAQPELALTLLRSVGWLSRDDLSTRTGHAGPAMETPGAQVPGLHRLRYHLFFHAGDWEQASVWRAAESALLPLVVGRGPAVTSPPPSIQLDPDCIQMSGCLPRPDGYDLRVLNASDRPQEATVQLRPQPAEVVSLTLAGDVRQRYSASAQPVRLSMRPWEIATLRIRSIGRARETG
jgi:alpha-mannosidase